MIQNNVLLLPSPNQFIFISILSSSLPYPLSLRSFLPIPSCSLHHNISIRYFLNLSCFKSKHSTLLSPQIPAWMLHPVVQSLLFPYITTFFTKVASLCPLPLHLFPQHFSVGEGLFHPTKAISWRSQKNLSGFPQDSWCSTFFISSDTCLYHVFQHSRPLTSVTLHFIFFLVGYFFSIPFFVFCLLSLSPVI